MKKKLLLICGGCFMAMHIFSQSLFTYGTNEVSKEEFIRAFNKNSSQLENKEQSLKEYLQLYSIFKLKVAAAKESKLDTADQLRYDMMNFRIRLENDFMPDTREVLVKTGYKKNPAVADEMLYLYADSAAYSKQKQQYPIAKEVIFSLGNTSVKASEWFNFAKNYKLNKDLYKGESNGELLEKFIHTTAITYFRKHLEEYSPEFKYQLQEFKEGNLFFEIMGKKVWNRSSNDLTALKQYYEANKEHFAWGESAEVILVNAKSYAYAEYALESIKNGMDWKNIAAESEGMIQGDSSRYELSQLPIKPGTQLVEGAILEIIKNNADNSASFVKIIKVYPAKLPRSFEEAKSLVINEYQQQLEDNWMKELVARYPVKVNNAVFQSLLK
ncbi:MAG: peptidyl-prolyl cis-trans isomerase [Chitinophagaceae bacterium]|nr:peptidyl-prolyl cis-trans isomerase [Chitinophagaceae bacterium]